MSDHQSSSNVDKMEKQGYHIHLDIYINGTEMHLEQSTNQLPPNETESKQSDQSSSDVDKSVEKPKGL